MRYARRAARDALRPIDLPRLRVTSPHDIVGDELFTTLLRFTILFRQGCRRSPLPPWPLILSLPSPVALRATPADEMPGRCPSDAFKHTSDFYAAIAFSFRCAPPRCTAMACASQREARGLSSPNAKRELMRATFSFALLSSSAFRASEELFTWIPYHIWRASMILLLMMVVLFRSGMFCNDIFQSDIRLIHYTYQTPSSPKQEMAVNISARNFRHT